MTHISFDDLDTLPTAPVTEQKSADIRSQAHIINGGDRAEASCPSCRGTGQFRSYTGRIVGNCFKCNGRGKITGRQVAAAKGKATKETNLEAKREQFIADHSDVVEFVRRNSEWSDFYRSMAESIATYGCLTENQLRAVINGMAKAAAKREAKVEERKAAAPVIDISGIEKLFSTAINNQLKKPIFRADGLKISKAPEHGRNAGSLYVNDDSGEYLGKISGGRFFATNAALPDTGAKLQAIAADPLAEAIKYARKFKSCSCCGKTLRNPVSVLSVIGPVCAEKWGLEHFRDMAREELAQIKAEEAAHQEKLGL